VKVNGGTGEASGDQHREPYGDRVLRIRNFRRGEHKLRARRGDTKKLRRHRSGCCWGIGEERGKKRRWSAGGNQGGAYRSQTGKKCLLRGEEKKKRGGGGPQGERKLKKEPKNSRPGK